MRLDRFLSNTGYGTRKEVKALLKQGKVTVNGHLIKADNRNIDEYNDVICFDGEQIIFNKYVYLLLNKPEGYVSSTLPERNYPPVTDLASEYDYAKVFPVGRLDVDTTGLLLLTNNGALAHRLIAPKFNVDKTYQVTVDYPLKKEMIEAFEKGIMLDNELTLPATLKIKDEFHAEVTIHQGKYHQVKRMFLHFGLTVIKLERSNFAFLNLDNVNQGSYRLLTSEEITQLFKIVNLD